MESTNHIYLRILLFFLASGLSTTFAWNPNIRRYESYDLEKGPVLYEAYYPDGGDNDFQEKRYFDRGVMLERSRQVPFNNFEASNRDNSEDLSKYLRRAAYQDHSKGYQYPPDYPTDSRLPDLNDYPSIQPSDIKNSISSQRSLPVDPNLFRLQNQNIAFDPVNNDPLLSSRGGIEIEESNLVRRAVPQYEIPKWNSYNGYYDTYRGQRARYLSSLEPRRFEAFGFPDVDDTGMSSNRNIFKEIHDVHDVAPETITKIQVPFKREIRDPLDTNFEPRYRRERVDYFPQNELRQSELIYAKELPQSSPNLADSLPPENIFQPRPQVINYIFSKAKKEPGELKKIGESNMRQDSTLRNYGDNLIQEEMKDEKRNEDKEARVTSIEVSEVPKHKTRHHHGEWPKRDYSHHHRGTGKS